MVLGTSDIISWRSRKSSHFQPKINQIQQQTAPLAHFSRHVITRKAYELLAFHPQHFLYSEFYENKNLCKTDDDKL